MKRFILFLLLIPSFLQGENTSIISKLKILKHISWYEDQAAFWKRKIDEDPKNPTHWHNYYFSLSNANAPESLKHQIAQKILSNWPDEFHSKLIGAKNYGFSSKGLAYYQQISRLDSSHAEVLSIGILLANINNDSEGRRNISESIYKKQLISSSLYNYAYNLLMSVGQDGILFTEGNNTSIPIFVLQDVLKVRTDIEVINTSLITDSVYQSYIKNKWSLKQTDKKLNNALINLPEQLPKKQFYYSLTINKELLEGISKNLHLTGLALKYDKKGLNSLYELDNNFSHFLIDYLITNFNFEAESATGRVLEPNYLLSLIILKDLYQKTGRIDESNKMNQLICAVSDHAGITEKVQKIIEPSPSPPINFRKDKILTKKIENKMKPIKEGILYASETEVSNEEYGKFLIYLMDFGYKDELRKAEVNISNKEQKASPITVKYFDAKLNDKQRKKSYPKYALTNVSHDAALLYCKWLTQQYNSQNKRKYKKVKFRLPTQQEWQIAALGYKEFQSWEILDNEVKAYITDGGKKISKSFKVSQYNIKYPWYGADFFFKDKIKNQNDCYLANILDSTCECPSQKKGDGFRFTSPVGSYFANGMGLFDMSGNVAEMLKEPGKAAGGSWAHPPESSTITSISSYNGPDGKVGFRVFMEVLEQF